MNMELMKAGYPPIDIKFTDRFSYNNAFDEYHVKHNLGAMEKLFAGYVNKRLDSYFVIFARMFCKPQDSGRRLCQCGGSVDK